MLTVASVQDLSDPEWKQLRQLALPLIAIMILFVLCSQLVPVSLTCSLAVGFRKVEIDFKESNHRLCTMQVQKVAPRQKTGFYIVAGILFTGKRS